MTTPTARHIWMVPLATDGLWLADLADITLPDPGWLHENLLSVTRQND